MPDYRELYLTLMREVEKSIRALVDAQRKCEEMYIESKEPELFLLEFPKNSAAEEGDEEKEKP